MDKEKEIKYKKRKKGNIANKKVEMKKKEKTKKENTLPNKKEDKNAKKKTTTKKEVKKEKKKDSAFFFLISKMNWKLLAIKLLILFITMMLVIFTISRIKKHHEKQNATFNSNISMIADATLKYFQNNPLPKNIGDSSSFILEEMKNLDLIDEIQNEENKFCNYLDSYIIFTKIDNQEYHLKMYLKCPNKEKIVKEKIICTENNCSIKK